MGNRINFKLRLTKREMLTLRDKYVSDENEMTRECQALDAGQRIAIGEFNLSNLEPIIRWKSPRPLPLIMSNSSDEVTDALCLAVGARTDRAAVAVLLGLRGVGIPVASAILTAIDPKRFTIIDYRALDSLDVRRPSPTVNDYLEYLAFCRSAADEVCVELRDLDRALWQQSKDTNPKTANRVATEYPVRPAKKRVPLA